MLFFILVAYIQNLGNFLLAQAVIDIYYILFIFLIRVIVDRCHYFFNLTEKLQMLNSEENRKAHNCS